jgi:hypothetical protein
MTFLDFFLSLNFSHFLQEQPSTDVMFFSCSYISSTFFGILLGKVALAGSSVGLVILSLDSSSFPPSAYWSLLEVSEEKELSLCEIKFSLI